MKWRTLSQATRAAGDPGKTWSTFAPLVHTWHKRPVVDIVVDPHPLLDLAAWIARLPAPLADCATPPQLQTGSRASAPPIADVPLTADDHVRAAVRDLLRSPQFKPTGRNKPASEYLRGVASLAAINVAVDICNLCSFHSGLPMSVVDLDRVQPPLHVGLAPAGASYIFNSAGQTIELAGLLGLSDAEGPCANPVKDAQRTKTHAQTRNTLYLVWGTRTLPDHAAQTAAWCRRLLSERAVVCEDVRLTSVAQNGD